VEKGLGDPIGVARHSRPSTESLHKWAVEVAADPARLALCQEMIAKVDPADLELWGHPLQTIWAPLESVGARKPKPKKLDRYRLERKAIVTLRGQVQRHPALRKLLATLRLGADVLLRD
jgi:hypothetical protein